MKYVVNPNLTDIEIIKLVEGFESFEVEYQKQWDINELIEPKVLECAENEELFIHTNWGSPNKMIEGRSCDYEVSLDCAYLEVMLPRGKKTEVMKQYGVFNMEALERFNNDIKTEREAMIKPYIESGLLIFINDEAQDENQSS